MFGFALGLFMWQERLDIIRDGASLDEVNSGKGEGVGSFRCWNGVHDRASRPSCYIRVFNRGSMGGCEYVEALLTVVGHPRSPRTTWKVLRWEV